MDAIIYLREGSTSTVYNISEIRSGTPNSPEPKIITDFKNLSLQGATLRFVGDNVVVVNGKDVLLVDFQQ